MKRLIVSRIRDNGVLTLGRGLVTDDVDDYFKFVSFEPSWILNEPYVSCIPPDTYPLVKRYSDRFDWHFHIKSVVGRSYCLIHTLNYFKQTEGCMGVGERFGYIDQDDQLDIKKSDPTLGKLLDLLPEETTIEIYESPYMQVFYNSPKLSEITNDV